MKNIILTALLMVVSLGFSQTYNNGTGDRRDVPKMLDGPQIAEFVIDVSLDSGETAYSRAYDLQKIPLVVYTTATGTQTWVDTVTINTRDSMMAMTWADTAYTNSDLREDSTSSDTTYLSGAGYRYLATLGTEIAARHNTVTETRTMSINLDGGDLMYSCYDVSSGTGTDSVKVYLYTQISAYATDGLVPFRSKSDAWTTLHTDSVIAESDTSEISETSRDLTFSSEAARFIRWYLVNTSTSAIDAARCRVYWTRKPRLVAN